MRNSLTKMFLALALITSTSAFAQDQAKGQTLYAASCIQCHGEKGEGSQSAKAPKLSGQYDWYLVKQLTDAKAGTIRKSAPMQNCFKGLTEQDYKDLAAYIHTL